MYYFVGDDFEDNGFSIEQMRYDRVVDRTEQANKSARKRGATGEITVDELRSKVAEANGICRYCKGDIIDFFHVDHMTPISRGGTNTIDNIQVICPDCNMLKSRKTHEQFLAYMQKKAESKSE